MLMMDRIYIVDLTESVSDGHNIHSEPNILKMLVMNGKVDLTHGKC